MSRPAIAVYPDLVVYPDLAVFEALNRDTLLTGLAALLVNLEAMPVPARTEQFLEIVVMFDDIELAVNDSDIAGHLLK
jgi:hypothetical protein